MNLVVAPRRPVLGAEGGGLKDERAASADADEVGEELVEAAGRRRGFARQAVVAAAACDEQDREDDGDQQEEEEDIGGRQLIDEVTHTVSRGAAALQHEEVNSRGAQQKAASAGAQQAALACRCRGGISIESNSHSCNCLCCKVVDIIGFSSQRGIPRKSVMFTNHHLL